MSAAAWSLSPGGAGAGGSPAEDRLRDLIARRDYRTACAELHAALAPDVFRYVRFLRPVAPVEDVCQDTWAAAMKALPRFRFASSPRVWLFGIAKRKVIDLHRRGRPAECELLDEHESFLTRIMVAGDRAPTSPSSHVARKERATALLASLGALNPGDRELLELRYFSQLTPREIVQVLRTADDSNTVSQRIVRAARRLRAELLKHPVFASRRQSAE